MNCEQCNNIHSGSYASGRFCSSHCRKKFAAIKGSIGAAKKAAITLQNKIEEYSLQQKLCLKCKQPLPFKKRKGAFCNRSCSIKFTNSNPKRKRKFISCKFEECKNTSHVADGGNNKYCKEHKGISHFDLKFEDIKSAKAKKRRLIKENSWKCWECLITTWQNKPVPLQMDHIDGNVDNESRENLRILCMNCHGLTETFCGKNIGKFSNTSRQKDRRYVKKSPA